MLTLLLFRGGGAAAAVATPDTAPGYGGGRRRHTVGRVTEKDVARVLRALHGRKKKITVYALAKSIAENLETLPEALAFDVDIPLAPVRAALDSAVTSLDATTEALLEAQRGELERVYAYAQAFKRAEKRAAAAIEDDDVQVLTAFEGWRQSLLAQAFELIKKRYVN